MAFEYTRFTIFQGRLAARKQATHKFDVERYNLRKLGQLKVRKQYHIKVSKRFAALEDLNDGKDVNRTWGTLKTIAKPKIQRV